MISQSKNIIIKKIINIFSMLMLIAGKPLAGVSRWGIR